jgi:tRNA U34 5-carboxymethylaminomethyl modifying enzyme MnmG/GidA
MANGKMLPSLLYYRVSLRTSLKAERFGKNGEKIGVFDSKQS